MANARGLKLPEDFRKGMRLPATWANRISRILNRLEVIGGTITRNVNDTYVIDVATRPTSYSFELNPATGDVEPGEVNLRGQYISVDSIPSSVTVAENRKHYVGVDFVAATATWASDTSNWPGNTDTVKYYRIFETFATGNPKQKQCGDIKTHW